MSSSSSANARLPSNQNASHEASAVKKDLLHLPALVEAAHAGALPGKQVASVNAVLRAARAIADARLPPRAPALEAEVADVAEPSLRRDALAISTLSVPHLAPQKGYKLFHPIALAPSPARTALSASSSWACG